MKAAGYNGQPIRFLTTTQYDYMFKIVSVAAANLQDVGFTCDVQVMDWPTMLQKRADPKNWEAFCTSGAIRARSLAVQHAEHRLSGWWDTPPKRAALEKFIAAANLPDRVAAWKELQALFYAGAHDTDRLLLCALRQEY